jgi:hypothetical protein
MKKAFYIFGILLLLPACSSESEWDKLEKSRLLCGSRLTVEEAAAQSAIVVHARALDSPSPGPTSEAGIAPYVGQFHVIAVLKGALDEKEIRVGYDCMDFSLKERRVRKGEQVILFMNERNSGSVPLYEAVKIIFAAGEAIQTVERIVSRPRSLPAENLRFVLVEPDSEKPGVRACLYKRKEHDYHIVYADQSLELVRDNTPVKVVGRLTRQFDALDSFEVNSFEVKENQFTAKVNVTRTDTNRVQRKLAVYFGFRQPDMKLKSGEYRVVLNFDLYVKPKMGPATKELKESFTEEYSFKVLQSPLCGSRMTIEKACKEADLIIHAKALDVTLGELGEVGVENYIGTFRVVSVLKGGLDKSEIRLSYSCIQPNLHERNVERGEEAVLFLQEKKKGFVPFYRAIKIILAADEAIEKVKKLLGEPGGG